MRGVYVDRGTQHMLGWGQRIATRTGVESPSCLALSVMLSKPIDVANVCCFDLVAH